MSLVINEGAQSLLLKVFIGNQSVFRFVAMAQRLESSLEYPGRPKN